MESTTSEPLISIVIPTLRENANLPILVERVAAALVGRSFEIVIVDDDSRDGTVETCADLARRFPLRLIVRDRSRDGLSGAVLEGLRAARGGVFVVMDADLQHPPEKIPELLAAIDGGSRFALGSRYVAGGGIAEAWGTLRRVNSRVATLLARPFARGVNDPMSGFFALPRATFEAGEHVAPTGYKIALELICKCRIGRVAEVPITFGVRERGRSKLSVREQFRYLEHLSRLYDFTYPRLVPAAKFVVTVVCAAAVTTGAFTVLRAFAAWPLWADVTLAYLSGIAPTALFHARYVRAQRAFLVRPGPWADFAGSAAFELFVVAMTAAYLHQRAMVTRPWEVLAIAFGAGTVARYLARKELLMDVRGLRFKGK